MATQLRLGDIEVEVELKEIKNVHLSVHPPAGRVHISAPAGTNVETIRMFAISKLDWIRQRQAALRGQEREAPREYIERESHYVWGKRLLLRVVDVGDGPSVVFTHRHLVLNVRQRTEFERKHAIVARFYRDQIKATVPNVVSEWAPRLGVEVKRFYVQQMKTKWGSCNPATQTIRLNTELSKKPKECLEYVVIHEMVHLLEPTHNARFVALMDRSIPQWQHTRQILNRLPVRHADWGY
jgi:predicted metal-dependent hydrolase